MKITQHFTLEELCASATAKAKGIKNVPGNQELINLTALCVAVLEPLRQWFGREVKIGSGYRCPVLNAAVGGVSNSQHMKGQAADLCIDGDMEKGKKWFNYIRNHLVFDQLIMEHNAKGTYWVHVSYDAQGRNRGQVIENLLKK
jgi:hypothetical protein